MNKASKINKRRTLDDCIKGTLREGPMVAIYYYAAMNVFKKQVESMSDKEINNIFKGLVHPDTVRKNTRYLYEELNNI